MREETKSLYIAIVLSLVVILATNWLFPKQNPTEEETAPVEQVEVKTAETAPAQEKNNLPIADVLKSDKRVQVSNGAISGSIRLKGARFDELNLTRYKQTLAEDSADVNLFSPAGTAASYYAEFGWLGTDNSLKLPNEDTVWQLKGSKLTPQTPIILEWNNGQGLKFVRKISVDDNYLFSIEQIVENNTGKDITLYPYGLINRESPEADGNARVVHEGVAGVLDSTLKETKFSCL